MSFENPGNGPEAWHADQPQEPGEPTEVIGRPLAPPPQQPPADGYAQQQTQQIQPQPQQPQDYPGWPGQHAPQPQMQQYPQQAPYQGAPGEPFGGLPGAPAPGPFTVSAEPERQPRTKLALMTGIGVVGIIGLATVLIMSQSSSASPGAKVNGAAGTSASASPTPSGFQPTATTAAGAAAQTAQVFLTAWESGNFKQAAAYTDDATDAQSVLSGYATGLNLSGLKITPGASTAAGGVSFSVAANVSSGGATTNKAAYAGGTWNYTSQLTAYKKDGGWWIKWDPTLVAAGMTSTTHPVALLVKPGASKVTDASGNDLSASSQTALQDISASIKQNTKATQGTAGLDLVLEDSSGTVVSGSKQVLSKAVSTATVTTTIDPALETLATSAVGELPRSSLVVLRPSTGAILAVANSAGLYDNALNGTLAPGSSFKVVSTTGLMVSGLLGQGINTPVGCPLVEDVQGVNIHNSTSSANSSAGTEDFEPNTTPFSTDFAQSCNNAFTQWWQQMAGGKLAGAAQTYYGLNEQWDIGLGKNTYFSMPGHQSGSELAEELYGQGQIQANPLTMASVAATVDTGSFHQPYLVSGLGDMATASPLPSDVKSQLWTVMREVITSGTADAVGFGSGVYGKTGTAEADANKDHYPNGWMIVFDPSKDLAIAAVVVDSNFGAKTAGPEVNYILQHS